MKCDEKQHTEFNQQLYDTLPTRIEQDNVKDLKQWLENNIKELLKGKPRDRFRKSQLSIQTLQLVGKRGRARKERNLE